MQTIYSHVYDAKPTAFHKPGPQACVEHYTIRCGNAANCALYAASKCLLLNSTGRRVGCPYGEYHRDIGPSRRSSKADAWVREAQSGATLPNLTAPEYQIALVGDFVYLPYTFMFEDSVYGGVVPREDFTGEYIHALVQRVPRDVLFGLEIEEYQATVVPQFLSDLKTVLPQVYNDYLSMCKTHTV